MAAAIKDSEIGQTFLFTFTRPGRFSYAFFDLLYYDSIFISV